MANVKSKYNKTKKKTEREEAAKRARQQGKQSAKSVASKSKESAKKGTKVGSHWGNVSKKAEDTEENRAKARTRTTPTQRNTSVTSHYGQVSDKTVTYGNKGKENINAKGGTADFVNKNRTGGVNFNIGGKTIASTTHKTDHSKEVDQKKSTGTHKNDKWSDAYSKGSNIKKTGDVAEKKTINFGNDLQNTILKAGSTATSYAKSEAQLTGSLTKQAKDEYKKYIKENGYEYNKDSEQKWIDYFNSKDLEFGETKGRGRNGKTTTQTRADIDKELGKSAKEYGKAVADAYAPTGLDYSELTAQEHDIMQKAAGMQGYIPKRNKDGKIMKDADGKPIMVSRANAYMDSQEKGLSEKVGSVTAAGAYNGKAATGFMQGSGMADVLHSGVGEYNEQAKNALKLATNSTGYNLGYGAGIMGQFMFGGIGTVGGGGIASLGESIGEGLAKRALKEGGEGILGKIATASQKNMATKFLTNRAGELAVESPLNFGDAVKMATDENGNVDKDALVKYMGVNSAMTFGMGGAIEGLGMGITKAQARQFENLYGKWLAGNLTDAEAKKMFALEEKLSEASNRIGLAKSRISDKSLYNAKVSQVLDLKRTPKETAQLLENTSIHSERMGYAQGLRDKALAEMEDLRNEREGLLSDPVKNADRLKQIDAEMKEASKTADVAERQLQVEINRNKHTLKDLTKSLDTMEKATGIKYDVMTNDGMIELAKKYSKEQIGDDDFIKGFIYKDENGKTRIAINSESPQAHQTVIGHETGHFLKEVSPEEFDEIGKMLVNYSKELGEYKNLVSQLRKCYPEATPVELQEEIRCELLGRYVYGMDDKFIKRLASNQPTIIKKIVDYFKQLLGKTTDKDLAKELRAIVDKVESATKNVGKNSDSSTGKPKFSMGGENAVGSKRIPKERWITDTDGKRKFEFSDANMKLKIKAEDTTKPNFADTGHVVDDLLTHKEFFDFYPEAKWIPVEFQYKGAKDLDKNTDGVYKIDPKDGTAKIIIAKGLSADKMEDAFIHELQHHIQSIEGFSKGATPEWWEGVYKTIDNDINSIRRQYNINDDVSAKQAVDKVKASGNATDAHKLQELYDAHLNMAGEMRRFENVSDVRKFDDVKNGITAYEKTKGEIEARLTAQRRKMSQEELNAKPRQNDKYEIKKEDYTKYAPKGEINSSKSFDNLDDILGEELARDEEFVNDVRAKAESYRSEREKRANNFSFKTNSQDDIEAFDEKLNDIGWKSVDGRVTDEDKQFLLAKAKDYPDDIQIQKITYDDGLDYDSWDKLYDEATKADKQLEKEAGIKEPSIEDLISGRSLKEITTNRDKIDAKRHFAKTHISEVKELTDEESGFLAEQLQTLAKERGKEITEQELKAAQEKAYRDSLNHYVVKTSDYNIDVPQKRARYTDERINSIIKKYTVTEGSNKGKSGAYVTMMNPKDFLNLTLDDLTQLEWQVKGALKRWDYDTELKNMRGDAPHLYVDPETGRVVGHEGRHRLLALKNSGITSVPVVIRTAENGSVHRSTYVDSPLKNLELTGQVLDESGKAANGSRVEVSDLVPVLPKYKDEITQKFGGEAKVKFSKNKRETLKPKQSTNQYEALATDDAHKKAGVSQKPVGELSKNDIGKEIGYLNARIRNGKTPASQELRQERLAQLWEEAEKRGMDIKNTPRKRAIEADVLIKNKGVGYEEAKGLVDEIEKLKAKQERLSERISWGGDDVENLVNQRKEIRNQLTQKRRRLDKVIKQSKTTFDESKGAYKDFKDRGLGNSSGHVDKTKLQAYKESLPEDENTTHDLWTSARRLFENSHVAFENQAKRVMKTDKKLGQDMLAQINNVIVARNIAAAWVQTARTNVKGAITGKSLNDVFKVKYQGKEVDLLKNDEMREDLSNYLYFKHAIAREKYDKDVFGADFTSADARAAMADLEDQYGKELLEKFGEEVSNYIKSLNQFRIDTGLISKAQLAELKAKYPDYVPTYRVNKNGVVQYDLSNGAKIDNGIKIAKGSDEPIEDLYLQLAKITDKTIKSGHQNKMVDMYAKSMGLEPKDIPKEASVEDMAKSNIVGQQEKNGDWTISYYRDGEQVTIPVDKQAAKGLREWNVQDKQAFIKLMSYGAKVTKPYKALITDLNLIFGARNGMRDAQQALVNSKDSYWYSKSIPTAASAVRHKDNAFRMLYDANGGKWSSIAQLSQLDDIAKLNKGGIKGSIEKGIEVIENINGAIEMMPRMSEFIGTIQKEADRILKAKDSSIKQFRQELEAELRGEHPNMSSDAFSDLFEKEYADRIIKLINKEGSTDNIIALAMRNASDITVNFSRSGIITKGLNIGLVPYLNPSVQGLSKTMRMFSEGKANETLLNFMFKMTMLTTAPAVMNEILCADNEAYQSLNTRDKDANFFIPLSIFGGDKDTFIKFPKPRENSVLAEPFEYFARILMDRTEYGTIKKGEYLNAKEIKQMFVSAQENVGIINIWEDNLISPIFKTMNNETWYGGAIESHSDMYDKNNNLKAPSERYDETTSPVAIWLGKWIGKGTEKAPQWKVVEKVGSLSPKKIDNLMDSYLGMIYDLGISQTSKKQMTDLKGDPLKRNPVFAQFLKDAVFSNKTSTQFWDKATKLNSKYGEKSQEYQTFMSKWGYDSFTYDNAITEVDTMKVLTPKQKVEMKRELRTMKNQLMERALEDKPVKYDPMQRIINLYDRYGVENATDKALSNFAYGNHKEAYEHLKSSKVYRNASPEEKEKWQQRFLNTYKDIKKIQRKTDGSDSYVDYSTAVYACVKNGYDKGVIANMYCWKSKEWSVEDMIERTKNYNDAGYTEKNFVATIKALNEGARKLKDDDKKFASELEDYDKAMILSQKGYRDGAFYITSKYLGKRMNAARCLTDGYPQGKWTDKKINKFCNDYNIEHDKNYDWDLEQVADAINDKYKNKSAEEKAAIFTVITGNTSENPFGEIGNYAHDNDSNFFDDEEKSKGGRGRGRGRRGRRGGGGGSSKGTVPNTASGAISARVTNPFTGNGSKKSNLNDAYRKKAKKLREQTHK